MSFLCLLILAADLATAHGSFLVNGWKVWSNASISSNSRIETNTVPVRLTFSSHQTLWIGVHTSLHIANRTISIEKGCAQLDRAGDYSLDAPSLQGLNAGSDKAELSRTRQILNDFRNLKELRGMSQRP